MRLGWFMVVLGCAVASMSGPAPSAPAAVASDKDQLIAHASSPADSTPSITASIRYDHPPSPVGWGSFDLSARPENHELRVDLVLGAPVPAKHWNPCAGVALDVDGQTFKVESRYTGVGMSRGVYDAIRAELSIVQVRAMATAQRVTARICDDVVPLPADELSSLNAFIAAFEELATYDGPPPPKPPRLLDSLDDPIFESPVPPFPVTG